ncbi:MAG: hypothetical protein AAGA20_23890 [Planctomycetota bacterium]
MPPLATPLASRAVHEIFDRVASDLAMLADRSIDVREVLYEERHDRPSAAGSVHISFRLRIDSDGRTRYGALMIPLAEAIAIAGYLMMVSEAQVAQMQAAPSLDRPLKEALLEVGTFVAGASDAAFRAAGATRSRVTFDGCQGVRENVPPAFDYDEGDPLAVGRALVSVADAPPVEFVVMLPRAESAARV